MQLKLSSTKLLLLNLKAQVSWREDAQPECDNCKPVITSARVFGLHVCVHKEGVIAYKYILSQPHILFNAFIGDPYGYLWLYNK